MGTTIYQHPLAYLLGLEGLAMLRGWAGDEDEAFTRRRLDDVRRLLDDPSLAGHPGVAVRRGSAVEGYRAWAPTYDEPNGLFAMDEPFVWGIVDGLRPGDALDAACGTGRFAEGLVARGHRVIGVDGSAEMLDVARRRVPDADLREGDLDRLPLEDDSVDLVVCSLALAHLPRLEPAMAEFARVLRPGGDLVISDVHHELILRGSVVVSPGPHGEPGLVPTYPHTPGDFLRAALPVGFQVLRCEEPGDAGDDAPSAADNASGGDAGAEDADPAAADSGAGDPVAADPGDWSGWPWSLLDRLPVEARTASWRIPFTINWHFRLAG